jgi:acyl-ACP thioesterase
MSLLEESACLSAEELGFGYSVLAPKNIGFILVNWHIQMDEPIKLGDKLTVVTWPIKPKKLIVFRDFELYVGDKKVGVATSRWCLVNLNNFTMLPSSVIFDDIDGSCFNDFRSVDCSNWKILSIADGEDIYSKLVVYSDYDHYNHVNNTKYGDFVMDVFKVDELKNKFIELAQLTYVKQTKEGEVLTFSRKQDEDGWLVEGKVEGELRIQFKVKFGCVNG